MWARCLPERRRSGFPTCQDKGRVAIARPARSWRAVLTRNGRQPAISTFPAVRREAPLAAAPNLHTSSGGYLLDLLGSAEAEVEFETIEPWDPWIDVLADQFIGQVFIGGPETFDIGRIVEGYDDGVVMNADIAIEPLEEIATEVRSTPGLEGDAETLTELVGGRLSDERHRHLSVADMEVEGSGAIPTESLIGLEELFDVPAFGVLRTQ